MDKEVKEYFEVGMKYWPSFKFDYEYDRAENTYIWVMTSNFNNEPLYTAMTTLDGLLSTKDILKMLNAIQEHYENKEEEDTDGK